MRQAGGVFGHGLSSARDQSRSQRTSRGNADLLSQYGPHCALERLPHAGDAQTRTAFHERRQEGVGAEGRRDRCRVGGEIEHAPGGGRQAQ